LVVDNFEVFPVVEDFSNWIERNFNVSPAIDVDDYDVVPTNKC
jgi:hypothetical protein